MFLSHINVSPPSPSLPLSLNINKILEKEEIKDSDCGRPSACTDTSSVTLFPTVEDESQMHKPKQ